MRRHLLLSPLPLILLASVSHSPLAQVSHRPTDPVTADPAPVDTAYPPSTEELAFQSQGSRLNGFFYLADGKGPHPTVILLHGFPGNERNLDLAQALRRAGMNVLFFSYRGGVGQRWHILLRPRAGGRRFGCPLRPFGFQRRGLRGRSAPGDAGRSQHGRVAGLDGRGCGFIDCLHRCARLLECRGQRSSHADRSSARLFSYSVCDVADGPWWPARCPQWSDSDL